MGNNQRRNAKTIYDFGSNNGDDIPYYLMKSDVVVAVEANPLLADLIRQRFKKEIAKGRVILESCVVTTSDMPDLVAFYVHRTNHVLSQFPKPSQHDSQNFDEIAVPARSVVSIIEQHGQPTYIKLDLEHYDSVVLKELIANGIHPPFISAESHTIEVFCLLVCAGYRSFNLVDGRTVSQTYNDHTVSTRRGRKTHSFPVHSAGPFGEDLVGPWLTPDDFFQVLAREGLGWKDVHATTVISPAQSAAT